MSRTKRLTPREVYPAFPFLRTEDVSGTHAVALGLSKNLTTLIDDYIERGWVSSLHDFSKKVGVPHSVVSGIIGGTAWANLETIARIETLCGYPLYPRQKKRPAHHKPKFLQSSDSDGNGYNRDPETLVKQRHDGFAHGRTRL